MNDIVGRWEIEWASALGTEHIALELQRDGDEISGTAYDDIGEYVLQEGRVDGDTATGSFRMSKPVPLTVTFTVKVRGDAMSGKAKAGFLPAAPITGRRVRTS